MELGTSNLLEVSSHNHTYRSDIQEHYSMQQKIGEGKFSVVYKCQKKDTKAVFALKVIEKFKLNNEEKLLLAY